MATLRGWFEEFHAVTGERPTHVVLGDGPGALAVIQGQLLEFTAVPDDVLDREFSEGYGVTESPNLCAWSSSWVVFSDDYDGAEGLRWVPRSPKSHNPIRPGGGGG